MLKNVSSQKIALFAFTAADGTPKTGDAAQMTFYVNKDWGAVTALGDTSAAELSSTNAPGWYICDLTQGETNANALHFTGKSSTGGVVVVGALIFTRPANFTSLVIDSSGRADATAVMVGPSGAATAQTAGDIIGDTNDIQTRLPAALTSDGNIKSDTLRLGGTLQTGRDIGGSVLLSPGTGTGQVNLSSGRVPIKGPFPINGALTKFKFMMTDSTNHNPATGLTVACTRDIGDGNGFVTGTLANVVEGSVGEYYVDFATGDLAAACVVLRATAAGADDTFVRIMTAPA